ncbi:MAG TPA: hypothetical protein VFR97_02510 [Capillimicrobium sp.]|nr:hypothetical protein [Capillimicrobium sp.]
MIQVLGGHVPVPRAFSAPQLDAEADLWAKPSAAVAFPFHPAGVLRLFDRARAVLEDACAFEGLTEEERRLLDFKCWQLSARLFAPGAGIRGALERVASDGSFAPRPDEAEQFEVAHATHLAAWAVTTAACAWAEELR